MTPTSEVIRLAREAEVWIPLAEGPEREFELKRLGRLISLAKAEALAEGWQPIETAPKDGTEILLHGAGRTTYGQWAAPSKTPHLHYQDGFAPEEVWEEFDPYWASWDGGFTDEHPPTHWRPLPPPPKEAP